MTIARNNHPIKVLSADLANKIAAGEVIERPASVVKELVENSIDAGATQVEVEVRDGGKEYIRVTDNGCGIERDELPAAFLRHATSKITCIDDLSAVLSLGFRGEALPSIASCAEVEITSAPATAPAARLVIRGGVAEPVTAAAGAPGTTIVIRRLFFNTPARFKFLKQAATERRYIAEYVTNMALAHPEVAFRLIGDNGSLLITPGSSDLLVALGAVYGAGVARRMLPVQHESPFLTVSGYVSPPDEVRPNRAHETCFVNGRWVQNRLLYAAVEKGYDTMLGARRYPVAVLNLDIDPSLLDVNVHPAKTEIRFRNESETFKHLLLSVRGALTGANLAPQIGTKVDLEKPVAVQTPPSSYQPSHSARPSSYSTYQQSLYPVDRSQPHPISADAIPSVAERVEPVVPVDQAIVTTSMAEISTSTPDQLAHLHAPLAAPEVPAEAEAVREYLRQAPVLGQVLDTYLVVVVPFGLWLVDQHVAHERVLYEQVLAKPGTQASQLLLMPVTLQLAPAEAALLESVQDDLVQLGFALEPFGAATYLVRAMPLRLNGAPDVAALRELLLELATVWESTGPSRRERAAAMIACKAAIKAGRRLEPQAQRALLQALARVENPFACPHGRPIMIGLDKEELERRFGRR